MFRPFLNEVLIGKVRSCTAEGLRVSVDFFDDIFVPKSNILMDNEFRHEGGRQKWVTGFALDREIGAILIDIRVYRVQPMSTDVNRVHIDQPRSLVTIYLEHLSPKRRNSKYSKERNRDFFKLGETIVPND